MDGRLWGGASQWRNRLYRTAIIKEEASMMGRTTAAEVPASVGPKVQHTQLHPQDLGIGRLFERIRDAVIVADAESQRIVLWNPAATRMFGYSSSEALELKVEALVPEPLKAQHRAGTARYAKTGHGPYIDSHEVLELPAVKKDGEEISVELSLSPIRLVDDTNRGRRFVLAIIRDVTERKWAEEALRQNEERFRLLVEGVKDYAIFMLDPEGRVTSWNEGVHRINGYSQQEILGRHFSVFYPDVDVKHGKPERALEIAQEKGTYEEEGWRVRKDGSRFWASVLITALWDKGGGLRGFAKVTRDITERKRMEEEIRRLNEDLEKQVAHRTEQLKAAMAKEQEGAQERERSEQELRVARVIQHTLLPKSVPELEGYQIATYYQPAREVGGDFYNFLKLEDGRLGLVVGDAAGEGVPAALVMANTQSVLRAVAQRGGITPEQVLAEANEVLYAYVPPNIFVTCFYAILDPESGCLIYANAGHDVPYLRRRNGDAEELRARGMPLGLMPSMSYQQKEIALEAGDSALFYSDGLVEAHDPKGEMFGFPRLRGLIAEHGEERALGDFLLKELYSFVGEGWEQEDDITLLTLRRSAARS
jgi:PAS domain S-box-containing protein